MGTELLFSQTMTELDFQQNRLKWSYLDLKGQKCQAYTAHTRPTGHSQALHCLSCPTSALVQLSAPANIHFKTSPSASQH